MLKKWKVTRTQLKMCLLKRLKQESLLLKVQVAFLKHSTAFDLQTTTILTVKHYFLVGQYSMIAEYLSDNTYVVVDELEQKNYFCSNNWNCKNFHAYKCEQHCKWQNIHGGRLTPAEKTAALFFSITSQKGAWIPYRP